MADGATWRDEDEEVYALPYGGQGPGVEGVVSERAWGSFPGLALAVSRWAELHDEEGPSDLVISAVPVGMDWISVRVTRTLDGDPGRPLDWVEWLAPLGFRGACQSAVDHFAARALEEAATRLKGRVAGLRGVADFPPVPARGSESEDQSMPKAKAKASAKEKAGAPQAAAPTAGGKSSSRTAAAPTPAKAAAPARRASTPAKAAAPSKRASTPAKAAAPSKRAATPTKAAGKK